MKSSTSLHFTMQLDLFSKIDNCSQFAGSGVCGKDNVGWESFRRGPDRWEGFRRGLENGSSFKLDRTQLRVHVDFKTSLYTPWLSRHVSLLF